MRLSDAIATGRVLIEPKPYYIFSKGGGGCALGMGLLGAGGSTNTLDQCGDVAERWPWLVWHRQCVILPCGCEPQSSYFVAIGHLFDLHVMGDRCKWTLDQLIDYVRSVEPAEPAEQPAVVTEAEQLERMRIEHYDSLANTR